MFWHIVCMGSTLAIVPVSLIAFFTGNWEMLRLKRTAIIIALLATIWLTAFEIATWYYPQLKQRLDIQYGIGSTMRNFAIIAMIIACWRDAHRVKVKDRRKG